MKFEWRSQLDPGIFIKENGNGYSSSISRGKAQLAEHVHLEARVAIRRAYYDHDKVCNIVCPEICSAEVGDLRMKFIWRSNGNSSC